MTNLNDRPFALIGVNTNQSEAKKLREVMNREKMNWRSFTVQESILERWNNPGTPTYYVIDPQGVIRHKWVGYPGEKALDTALEGLILEAERTGEGTPN
ncbi:MAG: TlpA family protein disulfide reductase [Isosphaeraceae bacterium]